MFLDCASGLLFNAKINAVCDMCDGSYCDSNSMASSYGGNVSSAVTHGDRCIDVCACPSSCQWASCEDIFRMVVAQTSDVVKAAEEVTGCTGCRHEETVGCLGAPGSLTCAARVDIVGDRLDFHNMEFHDCTLYHNSSALFAVTLFLATSVFVYVVYFVRRTTSRRGRVLATVTPVAWVEDSVNSDEVQISLNGSDEEDQAPPKESVVEQASV